MTIKNKSITVRGVNLTADLPRTIRDMIRRGELAPGEHLVEARLVRDLGASRAKVREALRVVAADGLVEIEENRGAYVRRLGRAEALQISRVRESLEGLAARLAAERPLAAAERGELRKLQSDMDDAARAQQLERYGRLNEAYHECIIRLAGNPHVAEFLERLRIPLFRLQFQAGWGGESMLGRNRDHRTLTKAILAGDGDAAEAAMRAHLRNGVKAMERVDDSFFA